MQLFFSPQTAPAPSPETAAGRHLQVFVLFTGSESTTAALRTASAFVSGLGGEVIIAATQIVPYPLPLHRPPVNRSVLLTQIANSVAESGIGDKLTPKALIVYARDSDDGWRMVLPPHCIVVVGRSKHRPLERLRSWNTARRLRKRGHEVLVA